MTRNFRSRPIGRRARKATQWSSTNAPAALGNLAAATSVIDSTFVTSSATPETILRIRGLFTVQSDQAAASETPLGAIGICVVSDQAVAAGVASVPTPATEGASDLWLMHQYFHAPMVFVSGVGVHNLAFQYQIDSKAMRKVSEDETMIVVVENSSSAHAMDFAIDIRVLAKESSS